MSRITVVENTMEICRRNCDFDVKTRADDPTFISFHEILRSYDYNMQVECLLPVKMCLITLVSKLGTMFAIGNIPPATRSDGEENNKFQNTIE